ncbi:MAG: twin-arginine translocase TatA/TatE family subunit [Fimbriimonadales bacterium]
MNALNLVGLIPQGQELWIILIVILVLFGGKKIPELLRGVGRGVGELQKGLEEGRKNLEKAVKEDTEQKPTSEA